MEPQTTPTQTNNVVDIHTKQEIPAEGVAKTYEDLFEYANGDSVRIRLGDGKPVSAERAIFLLKLTERLIMDMMVRGR